MIPENKDTINIYGLLFKLCYMYVVVNALCVFYSVRYCCKPPAISLFKSRILSFISSSTFVWNLSLFKAFSDYHSIK